MVSAMDDDGQHRHIGWIDARDACGLRQRLRTPFLQLLTTLKTNGGAFVVIEPSWNLRLFIFLRALCRHFLLTDIALVLTDDIDLLNNWSRQIVRKMTVMQMFRHQIGKPMGFFTDGRRQNSDTVSSRHQTVTGIVLTENQASFGT